jgi:hypothetical protein
MEISGTDISEDRIAALEKKLPEMEALVKGLIAELLDIKSITRTMSREDAEYNRLDLKRGTFVQGTTCQVRADSTASPSVTTTTEGNTVIRPRGIHTSDVPIVPAEPEMVRIMQSDGTMKMEPRYGEAKRIDSHVGYGGNRKGAAAETKQNPLIFAAEDEKSDRSKK